MKRYNWEFDFDPLFPVHLFEYDVVGHHDIMHWHRYLEIGLCLEGGGTFLYSHKEYPVKKGDVFITNNDENHVAVTKDGKKDRYLFLILLPSFISDNSNPLANHEYVETFDYNPPDFINRIAVRTPTADQLARLLRRGYNVYRKKEPKWEMELDIIVRNILLELARHYLRKGSEESARNNMNPRIHKACNYLKSHSNKSISESEVAAAVGLSTTYFRHLFKKEMHISYTEYLTHLRLNNARCRLIESDENINKIIEDVGCTNVSHFYRTFRQYYHMTPAQYRKTRFGLPKPE